MFQLFKLLKTTVVAFLLVLTGLMVHTGGLLADDEVLPITFYHYPPKILVANGVPTGEYVDQLEEVAAHAGYKVKWWLTDIDNEAAMLNAGKRAFCTTGRMPNKERAQRWRFLPFLFDVVPGDTVLVHPEKVGQIRRYGSVTQLANDESFQGALLMSGIYGSAIDVLLLSNPHWINRTGSMDLQLMRMVLAGRADWTIVPKMQWEEAKTLDESVTRLVEIPNFGAHPDYPIYIACSAAISDEMLGRLSEGMAKAGFQPAAIPE